MIKNLPSLIFKPLYIKRAIGGKNMNFNEDKHFLRKILPIFIYKIVNHLLHHKNFAYGEQVDHLIIGHNPIINLMLVLKILENAHHHEKITILETDQNDFWYYSVFEDISMQQEVSEIFNIKTTEGHIYEDIIQSQLYEIHILLKKKNIQLNYLQENRLLIESYFQHKELKLYILKLNKRKNMKHDVDKNFEYQNHIRLNIKNYFKKSWIEYYKKNNLFILQKTVNNRHNFILSKEIYLSSLPQGWLSCENEQKNKKITFKHPFSSNSFGTARNIILNSKYFLLDLIQTKQQIEKANFKKNVH